MNIKSVLSTGFRKLEIIFLAVVILSVIFSIIMKDSGFNVALFASAAILATAYFGFGFYLLGRPSASQGLIYSIICGIIYSISLISILFNKFKLPGKEVFFLLSISGLIILALSIYLNVRKGNMSRIFLNAQVIRILILFSLIGISALGGL